MPYPMKNTSHAYIPCQKLIVTTIFMSFMMIFCRAQEVNIVKDEQWLIQQNGIPFTGTARFKFLIYNDSTVLWSNDGSCFNLSEPVQSVEIQVNNGVYEADLGAPPTKPLFVDMLLAYPGAKLCTWINTGDGFSFIASQTISNSATIETDVPANDISNKKRVEERTSASIKNPSLSAKSEERKNKGKAAMNPEGLHKERMKRKMNENGTIPPNAIMEAKKHKDSMPPVATDDAGLWNWEWLGPGNIGGRIRAILIHPVNTNTIFIGSVSGGIWKSTNGGASWNVINDFLPSLAVSSFAIDPDNYDIMYASTGEPYTYDGVPGAGIFKSTDGGNVWQQLPSTANNDFKYVTRLAHHPDSSQVIYAVTSEPNKVYKSINGGTDWIEKFTANSGIRDLRINPNDVSRLIIGCNSHVYSSNDWGNHWELQSTGLPDKLPDIHKRCEVTYCVDDVDRIYVSMNRNSGEIWRSDNNGATWDSISSGYNYLGTQGNYDNAVWVDPTNSNFLVVGGIQNWRSTDGGSTLTQISVGSQYHNGGSANSAHADNHIIINHPDYDGVNCKTVFFGNDGGIQKATDITTVMQSSGWVNLCNQTLGITQFYGGASSPDGSVIIGGAQDNDVVRYRESGDWSGAGDWFQSQHGDGGACAIDFNNPDNIYSEYVQLRIKKSTDGGDTYHRETTGLEDADSTALFIAPFSMDPNNPTTLIAGGASIWRTINGAASWQKIRTFLPDSARCSAIDIAKGQSDVIWIAYEDGYVAKTSNGTAASPAWIRVDNNPTALPNRFVTDIAINPNDTSQVYITFGGYNAHNVWFTNNSGATWEERTGVPPYNLPALPVNTVRVHNSNSNWIYIGTDLGVFSSMDKGQSWSVDKKYSVNEGPVNVEVDELFWQGNEFLIAATHGRGMYRAHPLTTMYVDKNAQPGGNGSFAHPFNTITEAVNKAGYGTNISIKSNTYSEPPVSFSKKGRVKSTNGVTRIK
jgi:photosystem II stability/assembly factor-like uncharacterized protein